MRASRTKVLAQRFVQRWDLYARQLDDGRYVCVHEPLNVDHLFGHLRGEITLGTYLLDQESKARFLVLDADDKQGWARLGHLARELAGENVTAYLEKSRRGGHLWLFLGQAVAGREARSFCLGLLAAHRVEGVELFPKQDQLADGPGSLIRMPFGVHRLTGRCYGFYTADGIPLWRRPYGSKYTPWELLRRSQRLLSRPTGHWYRLDRYRRHLQSRWKCRQTRFRKRSRPA